MDSFQALQVFRRGRKVRYKKDGKVLGEIQGTALKERVVRGSRTKYLSVRIAEIFPELSHHVLEAYNGRTKEWE